MGSAGLAQDPAVREQFLDPESCSQLMGPCLLHPFRWLSDPPSPSASRFFTRDSTAALTAQLDPQPSTHDCKRKRETRHFAAPSLSPTVNSTQAPASTNVAETMQLGQFIGSVNRTETLRWCSCSMTKTQGERERESERARKRKNERKRRRQRKRKRKREGNAKDRDTER